MSIVRFTVDTPTLPILIVQPRVGADANLTVYVMTMKVAGGGTFSYPIRWNNYSNRAIPKPNSPVQPIDQTNPYYYCYTVYNFLVVLNQTLEQLYRAATGYTYAYPYFNFDPTTNLFTVGCPVENFRTSSNGTLLGTDTQVELYFNTELYNLFSSLPAIYKNQGNNEDYQLLFSTGTNNFDISGAVPYAENIRTNSSNTRYDPYNDVLCTQEYPTIALWNPVKSLVFRTNLLTPVPELVGTPYIVSSSLPSYDVFSQNSNIEQILIDHVVPHTLGFEGRPSIYYEPTGEYRLTDLQGNEPVRGLAITAYWKDWQNQIHPFVLGLGCSATIKILFRKKIFNSVLL